MVPGEFKRYIVGQVTANGTTEVTIEIPSLEASSIIIPSLNTVGGTPSPIYTFSKNLSTKTVGFKASASNTCVYDIVVLP